MKKIIPLFSYLFHPVFIPVMATFFYILYKDAAFESKEKYFIFFQTIMFTLFIPILLFLLLRSIGKINSIMMGEISQRKIPLILQCFLVVFLVRRSITLATYPELHFFFLAALLSIMVALLLLFVNVKTSLHMMAISGLTVFVFALGKHLNIQNHYTVGVLILITGCVAFSRLEMKAHTPRELYIGFFLGVVPQVVFAYLWL